MDYEEIWEANNHSGARIQGVSVKDVLITNIKDWLRAIKTIISPIVFLLFQLLTIWKMATAFNLETSETYLNPLDFRILVVFGFDTCLIQSVRNN